MEAAGVLSVGFLVLVLSLQDAFEVVLLPRTVERRKRLWASLFYRVTWPVWSQFGRTFYEGRRREDFLGIYGPLSMVLLFAGWAFCLIVSFGLMRWGISSIVRDGMNASFLTHFLASGDTFFTLGYGNSAPHAVSLHLLTIIEAGTGFAFIALMVSYLPVLYQHFSERDAQIVRLHARAGSPPTAATLLQRYMVESNQEDLLLWLGDWEVWAAELTESHSSYPMLMFYRSQHENHSWLASLATMLDASSLIVAGFGGGGLLPAASAYVAARRVLHEMTRSLGLQTSPLEMSSRLPDQKLATLDAALVAIDVCWQSSSQRWEIVSRLRKDYEPMLDALSAYLLLPLPKWFVDRDAPNLSMNRLEIARRIAGGTI